MREKQQDRDPAQRAETLRREIEQHLAKLNAAFTELKRVEQQARSTPEGGMADRGEPPRDGPAVL